MTLRKNRIKPFHRCECGWDIRVCMLDVRHEFPHSEVALANCPQCDSATFIIKGRKDDTDKFSSLMETLRDHPEDVIKARNWRPISFSTPNRVSKSNNQVKANDH